jgi:hypothetical protein
VGDLSAKMTDAERHLVQRLVAFFATGDSIVANNLVLNLYRHLNAPEARMYLSRQLYEEALHVQFYLTLLDTYVPDPDERPQAFAAVETIPSIRARPTSACAGWTRSSVLDGSTTPDRCGGSSSSTVICFAACIEGLFFFGAFAYVYFLRSRGLLHGLAAGTSWVFRDESAHMAFAFEVVDTVRREEPELFDAELARPCARCSTRRGLRDAVRRGPAGRRRGPGSRWRRCARTLCSSAPISAWPGSDWPGGTALQESPGLHGSAGRAGGPRTSSSGGCPAYQVGVVGESCSPTRRSSEVGASNGPFQSPSGVRGVADRPVTPGRFCSRYSQSA